MSFIKSKMTKFGVNATFHTVTTANMNFAARPTPVLDENSNVIGVAGGSVSSVVLSSFVSKAAYLEGKNALEAKQYSFDFMTALGVVRSTQKTCEDACYDLIVEKDQFWSDAERDNS